MNNYLSSKVGHRSNALHSSSYPEGHILSSIPTPNTIFMKENKEYCRISLKRNPQSKLCIEIHLLISESYILAVVTVVNIVYPSN